MTNNHALLTASEKLQASIYLSVSKICKSTGNDNTVVGFYNFHKDAVELISEIIFKKLEIYSEDLEAFAKNRKQTTVNVEDVKLLVRRNPKLKEHITTFIENQAINKKDKNKKKKTLLKKDQPSSSSKNTIIEID